MRDHGVELGVVSDLGKVTITVERHHGVHLEGLKRELVCRTCQLLSGEGLPVTLEEFLHDTDHRALTGARITVEDECLLNRLGVTGDDRTDSPLDLTTLLFVVERAYHFVPRRDVSVRKGIWQPLGYIILFLYLRVGERNVLIQLVVVILEMRDIVPVGHPRIGFPVPEVLPVLFEDAWRLDFVLPDLFIDQSLDVKFVSGPHSRCFIPNGVEGFASDHQILRTENLE